MFDVIKNRHNKITTAYYLILKRKIRNGEISIADISSNSTSFIKYIKSPISKMAYWNNDYEKITEYYVKSVKKFLKSISEENSSFNGSKADNNNNGNIQNENKENQNTNNLKSLETNTEKIKLNIEKITPNNELNDNRCHTEMNSNNNNSNKDINQNNDNHTFQNGGTIISTIYDDNLNNLVHNKSIKNKMNVRHNYSMDESEEPTQQKINESYRPNITIKGFLQTDANNIKMNARLIKEKNKLDNIKNNFNEKTNILKSEESTNIGDIINTNTINNNKEIENNNANINRILLTEMDNIGVKNIQKSLLNKNTNNNKINTPKNTINSKTGNNSIETYSKKMVNNKPKNININSNRQSLMDDYVRIHTLYNKDDNEDLITTKREDASKILTTENNDSKYLINKTDLVLNTIPNKIINGLNENNTNAITNDNNTHNKTKSVEKNLVLNINEINKEREREKEKNKFYVTLPFNNQIYKQEKIMKFINQKTPSMPKTKEDSKKNISEIENGKLLFNNTIINKNKHKFKNRYSQENINPQYKIIHGTNTNGNNTLTRPNGSNEISLVNKNIAIYSRLNNLNIGSINNNNMNIGNMLYVKKKRKPKSIDNTINRKNFLISKKESKNNMTIENKNNNINTSMNNKEIYLKVNHINYKKQFFRDKINEQKYLDDPFLDSFRTKKLNNNFKTNKKTENDLISLSNITHRLNSGKNSLYLNNNNFNLEKTKNKEIINHMNVALNKNNKIHEHNSFDGPKHIKNKIKQTYINHSMEKNRYINNNINMSKYSYNNNYFQLNKKIKQYYRNIGSTKQNQPVTQYYGINNFNKIINNYNIDNIEKISNHKIQAKNQRMNYKIPKQVKANSVDEQGNKSKTNLNKEIPKKNNDKIKNKKKSYLNTSVIKDKTPKNFITSFYKEKNKVNNIII